jgi:hypothetical protein
LADISSLGVLVSPNFYAAAAVAMRRDGCRTVTTDADKLSFPCSQAWIDDARGHILWDGNYLYEVFRNRKCCGPHTKKNKWFRSLADRVSRRFGADVSQGLLDAAAQSDYTLSSLELLSFYAVAMDTSSPAAASTCEAYMIRNIDLAISVSLGSAISCSGVTLSVEQGGIVPNFAYFLQQYFDQSMFAVVESSWSEQARRAVDFKRLDSQSHHVTQCVLFLLTFFSERRAYGKRPLSRSNAAVVNTPD